jgi:hypothetical protein
MYPFLHTRPTRLGFLIAISILASCASNKDPQFHPTPRGTAVGARSTACEGYLARSDIQALLGDPSLFTESSAFYRSGVGTGTCGLYDPSVDRYVLRFDISTDMALYNEQLEASRTVPGAISQNKRSAVIPDPNGLAALALVRLPKAYVVVYLRKGPFTPDRLSQVLDIASKVATAVPAPFGTSAPRLTNSPRRALPTWSVRTLGDPRT